MSGKYPVTWFDIKDNFNKRLIGGYRKDIKEGFKIDDPAVLTFYEDYKTKTKWYKYIIDKSDENGFLIHSENNCGAQNWIADNITRWFYFIDKKEELEEIERREKKIKSDKFLFVFSNENRRIKAIRDLRLFQDSKAFDVLFNVIEGKHNSVDLRRTSAGIILHIPQLQRFKSYLPRIDEIIIQQKEIFVTLNMYPNWQEYNAYKYLIKNLQDLKKIINGEIEGKRQIP